MLVNVLSVLYVDMILQGEGEVGLGAESHLLGIKCPTLYNTQGVFFFCNV